LRLVVTFSWKDEDGVVHGSEGKSRDLNGRGIYVQAALIPPVGSYVEMDILLQQLAASKGPVELHAEGRVVRTERAAGFASMNHTVVLRDSEGREINGQNTWKDFGFGEP
jgi:hypothetical protein